MIFPVYLNVKQFMKPSPCFIGQVRIKQETELIGYLLTDWRGIVLNYSSEILYLFQVLKSNIQKDSFLGDILPNVWEFK